MQRDEFILDHLVQNLAGIPRVLAKRLFDGHAGTKIIRIQNLATYLNKHQLDRQIPARGLYRFLTQRYASMLLPSGFLVLKALFLWA
ncbi:protein of unknown function, might belong to Protein unc-80 homolog [Shewanella benthica]|uniref:Uncharacterized protein n=1 Tax=Shewanella benthica TaxID=43661 RepID=A0A330M2A0_9GAMM|nr:protein of unknown function, might belong to Protein unc-80 homolog [Shewanella benthica]